MATTRAPRAAAAALAAASSAIAQAESARAKRATASAPAEPAPTLTAAERENPDKLTGQALRDLAHRRGIARSESARMDDAKLRMQLRYITNRQYASEDA